MKLFIVSGRSGSGKSIALHILEDLGFYCIDNLPVGLISNLPKELGNSHTTIAVSIDARNLPTDLAHIKQIVQDIKKANPNLEVLYLDADANTLLKRFSETRRKHPLSNDKVPLIEAIDKERELLEPIANLADLTIDTSQLSNHQLRSLLRERISNKQTDVMSVMFESFGYKYGIPADADYVFDVRCLPNPYWNTELRPFSGLDQRIMAFMQLQDKAQNMLHTINTFLETWIPDFEADNRSYLTIAIGCTGGRHRSVYLVEQLAAKWRAKRANVQIRHREL
jgi:RNase adapter protein RapZ